VDPYEAGEIVTSIDASTPLAAATAKPASVGKARRLDLDRAKGLGILLVVLGHLAAKSQPQGNDWFAYLQTALYQFHMPFFMYLSGYVCYLSGAARAAPAAWPHLIKRRAARLVVPFVIFGLALIVGKLAAAQFIHVDNTPVSLPRALIGMIWDTDNSPAISVWYIFVVFVLTILTPAMFWFTRGRLAPLLLLAAVVYLLPIPHVMYLDRVARFLLFFSLGGAAATMGNRWLEYVDRFYLAALAVLAIFLVVVLLEFDAISDRMRLFMCGVASMPALHGLVRRSGLSHSGALLTLGAMSFVIYLLNTPFIGLVKGILLKFMSWDGVNFLVFLPLMMVAGTLGPILLKRYLFGRVPAIDRITD
jgi:fucose 4-O-acetylase-like acetyltransferase